MSPRRRQTARELAIELVLVAALIGGLYVFVFSGAAAELGRIIGQALEDQALRERRLRKVWLSVAQRRRAHDARMALDRRSG